MRTTIELPDPLFRLIKAQAAMEGTSLKRLITRYVERGLGADGASSNNKQPLRSPAPVIRAATGNTLPALGNSELQKLLDNEDVEQTGNS